MKKAEARAMAIIGKDGVESAGTLTRVALPITTTVPMPHIGMAVAERPAAPMPTSAISMSSAWASAPACGIR